MALIKCPECGNQVSDHAKLCPSCGIEIMGNIKTCPDCGHVAAAYEEACRECGSVFESASEAPKTTVPEPPKTSSPEPIKPQTSDSPTPKPSERVVRRQPRPTESPARRRDDEERNSTKVMIVAFLISLILVAGGLLFYFSTQSDTEQRAYNDAMESTAAVVLQSYLNLYKDAPEEHKAAVMKRLAELNNTDAEWDSVLARNTLADYEAYISRYPESIHVVEAAIKADSLSWIKADSDSTFESYTAYINAHPDGIFVDEARMRAEKLDPTNVTEEEKQKVRVVVAKYFKAQSTANADGGEVSFKVNDDIDVEKKMVSDSLQWRVSFNVDKKITFPDATKSSMTTYKYDIKLSADMEISNVESKEI